MKPICVKCERFYRPKKNGTAFIEMMPKGGSDIAPPGTSDRDMWTPYKLWIGDLWHCLGCGNELIVGSGHQPLSEHYKQDFAEAVESWQAKIIVNDC